MQPDLCVQIGGIRMKNPVMVASGTFGYGEEYADVIDTGKLGAIVVKGVSALPWDGNDTPRLVEVRGGVVNAIGLQNPGVEAFISEHMPHLRKCGAPVIVNVWGRSEEEYGEVARELDGVEGVAGIELNISCPNIKKGGLAFGTNVRSAGRVVAAARKAARTTLIVKLAPNVPDISLFVRAAQDSGADAVSLINSVPAMVIDIEERRPVLANVTGGLTGPAVHPIAVKLVWEAAKQAKIPVIAMGGIADASDALEFIIAGATAVAVGTANFADPLTPLSVVDGIRAYLTRHGIASVRDLIGSVKT